MFWQPNLWPVTLDTKPSKVSSGQSLCQMVSQHLSATNMLITPPCMCFSHQMLRRLFDSSIALFCSATCSQLNVSKSRGLLVQAQPLASASVAALPSISFITGQQTIKHLGVLLGYDMRAASHQQFTGISHAMSANVRHWAARGLSFLGRVHVAKQVLAASL